MEKMKELLEKLKNIGDLTDEQLAEIRDELTAVFEELSSSPTDENLEVLESEVAPAIMQVRETMSAREEDLATRAQRVADLASKVKAPEAPAKVEEAPAPVVEAPAAPAEPEIAVASEPELVMAAAEPTAQELNARRPEAMAPRANGANSLLTVVAAGDVPGYSAGMPFSATKDIGEAMARKCRALEGMKVPNGSGAIRYPVAQFQLSYPDDRKLELSDVAGNTRKVMDVIGAEAITASVSQWRGQAITAAGGLCAPLEGHYELHVIPATAARPLKDSFAKFGGSRGGIRFITPPTLDNVTGAVGHVTEANDQAGYPPANKPIVTITCGTETTAEIAAVTLRLQVGEFSHRTFPEQFDAWYSLALGAHARRAEQELLDIMSANSTAITTGQVLGAARDLLVAFDRVLTRYRSHWRMDGNAVLNVAIPSWVLNVFRADLVRQMPGDGLEALSITEAAIRGWFRDRNANPVFYLDERDGAGQIWGAQVAGPAVEWPSVVEWYVYTPDSYLFVDGGTLDLGVEIRDTTTIASNNLQAFMETFETLAFVGAESLRVRSTICIEGSSGGTVDIACPSGS